MKKAQSVSTEFIFGIAIIMVIFIIVFSFIAEKGTDISDTRKELDLRAECLKVSNLISSVYAGGDGTEARIELDNTLTISSSGVIYADESGIVEHRVAAVASEATPTTQEFYDNISNSFGSDVNWFKSCFDDIGIGAGCQDPLGSGSTISFSIDDLMQTLVNSPDTYITVYLDAPYIKHNASYNGKNYTDILADWVSNGHALILSGYVMCNEQNGGSYSADSSECNPGWNYRNNVWNIFGVNITQIKGTSFLDVTTDPDPSLFPSLNIGDTIKFVEKSYIYDVDEPEGGFTVVADYNPKDEPAILYWNYGRGLIIYFGDSKYSGGGGGLSQDAIYGIITASTSSAFNIMKSRISEVGYPCTFYGKSPGSKIGSGSALIENRDGEVMLGITN